MPTEATLASYYSAYYDSDKASKTENTTFQRPERLAKRLASSAKGRPGSHYSILDFGGGDGTIGYSLAEELTTRFSPTRIEVVVVDPAGSVVSNANSRISIRKEKELSGTYLRRFDVVIASAVLEHFPEPGPLLHDLLQHVSGGGLFYARTPTMLPIMSLLKKLGIDSDFTFPGHLHDLGQNFWETYFQRRRDFELSVSRPSIIETHLCTSPVRTLAAAIMKAPWYALGKRYKFVGGWEVMATKREAHHT